MNIPLSMALLCVDCDCISEISKELGSAYCGHCSSWAVLKLDRYIPTMNVMITPESKVAVNGPDPTTNSGTGEIGPSKLRPVVLTIGLTVGHTLRYIRVVSKSLIRLVKRRTNIWLRARQEQ